MNYFKVVATNEGKNQWMVNELKNGRLRFGWSSEAYSNLIKLQDKEHKTDHEKYIWRMCQFIVNRLEPEDILLIQLESPFRRFLLARVVERDGRVYDFDGAQTDFNHIINCELITDKEINLNSKYLSKSFKRNLTKRGQYYKIYEQATIDEINFIINNKAWNKDDVNEEPRLEFEIERTKNKLIDEAVSIISYDWRASDFEELVTKVFNALDGVTAENRDSGNGLDIMVKIQNPLIKNSYKEIPVQCKIYEGDVNSNRPIEDLEKCIIEHNSDTAYLVIIGNLSEAFFNKLAESEEKLSMNLQRDITYEVIDERDFAELYLSVMNRL